MNRWIRVCDAAVAQAEDVIRLDHEGRAFAVYRVPGGSSCATDGLCTHEQIHLADGRVTDRVIECQRHNGRFDHRAGEPRRAPVCIEFRAYPVKIDAGAVFVDIG